MPLLRVLGPKLQTDLHGSTAYMMTMVIRLFLWWMHRHRLLCSLGIFEIFGGTVVVLLLCWWRCCRSPRPHWRRWARPARSCGGSRGRAARRGWQRRFAARLRRPPIRHWVQRQSQATELQPEAAEVSAWRAAVATDCGLNAGWWKLRGGAGAAAATRRRRHEGQQQLLLSGLRVLLSAVANADVDMDDSSGEQGDEEEAGPAKSKSRMRSSSRGRRRQRTRSQSQRCESEFDLLEE